MKKRIKKFINNRPLFFLFCFILGLTIGLFLPIQNNSAFIKRPAPSLNKLNLAIMRAETYYEGLYKDLGSKGGVVVEYYSHPKSVYTIRHATIGGIYFYDYIGNASVSAQLKKLVIKYGFKPEYDEHSFIWTYKSSAPANIVYSPQTYHDCDVKLPSFGSILPYHSKVCKLDGIGVRLYILATKFDTFVPMVNALQKMQQGKKVDVSQFEQKYNNLGFGMPLCNPVSCSTVASTIRTATFGELELRVHHMQYADAVANELVSIEDKNGAIYLSYDNKGHFSDSKPFTYAILDKFLNDTPVYNGYIPTNAESMEDALAFLLHYRCQKYQVCQANLER